MKKQLLPPELALFSLWDKRDIVPFARSITSQGWEIAATEHTFEELKEQFVRHGIDPCFPVSNLIDMPEMFNGKFKTLHPRIQIGLMLDRSNPEHMQKSREHNIRPIGMVVANPQPFTEHRSIERTDAGGLALLFQAIANWKHVIVVVSPNDFQTVAFRLEHHKLTMNFRRYLMMKAALVVRRYSRELSEEAKDQFAKNPLD